MSDTMRCVAAVVSLTLYLLVTGGATILQDVLERGPVSLNDMFREVEMLMEDTQHILEEAVDQVCVTFSAFIQGERRVVRVISVDLS